MKKQGIKISNTSRHDFQLKLAYDFFEKKVILPSLPCPSPLREIRRQMTASKLSSPKLVVPGKNEIPKKCDLCPSQKRGGKRSKYTCALCEKTVCVQHRRPVFEKSTQLGTQGGPGCWVGAPSHPAPSKFLSWVHPAT